MSSTTEGKSGCLCGAVQFTVKDLSKNAGACHCSMCSKWTGGPSFPLILTMQKISRAENTIEG